MSCQSCSVASDTGRLEVDGKSKSLSIHSMLLPDILDVLRALQSESVDYVVFGAVALNIHEKQENYYFPV